VKVYNKFEHLLVSGQFKKKINMHVDKLLHPPLAFYHDKMLPAMETGLSRIELSKYYHSFEDSSMRMGDIPAYEEIINIALNSLNVMKDKFMYTVSLSLMLKSYFAFCKTQLVAFDNNIQVIVYSYNQRSHTYVGDINNRTGHSPSTLRYLKTYLTGNSNAYIFYLGRLMGDVVKDSPAMQYPIRSFNFTHKLESVQPNLD
jgi:hypothetical protein